MQIRFKGLHRQINDKNIKIILCTQITKLELRESDVSPCEQYSLREMAKTKMKFEN
jgi:hypothetical protein